jgi:hypothetical protein
MSSESCPLDLAEVGGAEPTLTPSEETFLSPMTLVLIVLVALKRMPVAMSYQYSSVVFAVVAPWHSRHLKEPLQKGHFPDPWQSKHLPVPLHWMHLIVPLQVGHLPDPWQFSHLPVPWHESHGSPGPLPESTRPLPSQLEHFPVPSQL